MNARVAVLAGISSSFGPAAFTAEDTRRETAHVARRFGLYRANGEQDFSPNGEDFI